MSICCRCRKTVLDEEDWYGLHKCCFIEWFALPELCRFSDIIPRSQPSVPLEDHGKNTSFFHGAFRKYSSSLGKNNYILKVFQKDHLELPATEFLCNQISLEELTKILEGGFIGEKRRKALLRLIGKRSEELCGI